MVLPPPGLLLDKPPPTPVHTLLMDTISRLLSPGLTPPTSTPPPPVALVRPSPMVTMLEVALALLPSRPMVPPSSLPPPPPRATTPCAISFSGPPDPDPSTGTEPQLDLPTGDSLTTSTR